MPIQQPFYINGPSLASATAVFLDAALTICAPDGFYSDASVVREQVGCILLPENTCPTCCSDPCSGWTIISGAIAATISYIVCGSGVERNVTMDYPATLEVCAAIGTTPFWANGIGDITNTQSCGCCAEACAFWRVKPALGFSVDVAWTGSDNTICSNDFNNATFTSDELICVAQGTTPTVEGGTGSIEFYRCGCVR